MATSAASRSTFFLCMAYAFLVIAVVGFSTTFFVPLAKGVFQAKNGVRFTYRNSRK